MSTGNLRSALLVTTVAVATLLTTATAATAGPASAHRANPCPSRSLCLYEGANFTGEMFPVTSLVPGGTCVSLVDHGWGDRAHSAVNTHSASAAMFMNDDCLGGPYQVAGNSSLTSFGSFTPESVWVPYRGS
ncbi:peptidase inhibitor family I36 protein [Plantactinospora sp. WMMC1484]|uniref:peptidase inhibitor family I36 protein n=1 Tax=Plantactinospora sp. WMMC1484 TaxID=3404122 RepID=UPI003BF4C517